MKNFNKRNSFTLIEMIITIVLLGLIFIPLGIMTIEYVEGIFYSRDLGLAQGLITIEMAKINNLDYDDSSLEDGDDDTTSDYEGYHLDLNRKIDIVPDTDNDLKKVEVTIYQSGTTIQLAKAVTYVADVLFGAGSGGGAAGGGDEVDSLVITSGDINKKVLRKIDMQNTSTDDAITIDKVIVSWGGANTLTTIAMGGVMKWSGSESISPTTIDITDFVLAVDTFYNNTGYFTFSSNLSSATLTFIMSDLSQTSEYSW